MADTPGLWACGYGTAGEEAEQAEAALLEGVRGGAEVVRIAQFTMQGTLT